MRVVLHCFIVFQKFDPNFNPIKTSGAISASSSTESVIHNMFMTIPVELPTPGEYINTEEHLWDSNSTGSCIDSYFICSSIENSDSLKHHDHTIT